MPPLVVVEGFACSLLIKPDGPPLHVLELTTLAERRRFATGAKMPDSFWAPRVVAPVASVEHHLHAYVGTRATSAAAAAQAYPRTGTQRRRVLDAILDATRRGHGGATDPELCRHLDMGPNSERPRRVELVEQGYVEESGLTRTHDGRAHIVWRATPEALHASIPEYRT